MERCNNGRLAPDVSKMLTIPANHQKYNQYGVTTIRLVSIISILANISHVMGSFKHILNFKKINSSQGKTISLILGSVF